MTTVVQSPIYNDNRIISIQLANFATLDPIFLNKIYSTTIMIIMVKEKIDEVSSNALGNPVGRGTRETIILEMI